MDSEGRVVFFSPLGRAIAASGDGAPPLGTDPVRDLAAANRRRGADPQWDTIMPSRHHHSPMPWEVEADAWEALDRAAAKKVGSLDRAAENKVDGPGQGPGRQSDAA
jgi:hypothetical protein